MESKKILCMDIFSICERELMDILPPTDDLSDISFFGGERDISSLDRTDDLISMEESEIQSGRKEGMMHKDIFSIHRIFEPPEVTSMVRDKILEK